MLLSNIFASKRIVGAANALTILYPYGWHPLMVPPYYFVIPKRSVEFFP